MRHEAGRMDHVDAMALETLELSSDAVHTLAGRLDWCAASSDLAWLVRPIELIGFGAHREVESMIVERDGSITGEILGPALSAMVARHVLALTATDDAALIETELHVDGDEVAEYGLTCGGSARLLVERADRVPATLIEELGTRAPVAFATRLDPDDPGTLVVDAHGVSISTLGDGLLDQHVEGIARAMLARGGAARRVEQTAATRLLIDAYAVTPQIVIVGSGDLAVAITAQGTLLEWDAVTVDDLESAVAAINVLSRSDAVVVLSHDPDLDAAALLAAVRSDVGYCGALGSRRTQEARAQRLVALGATPGQRDAIHGPAGLDLGASGPAGTAVSIFAEIFAVRSERSARPLREQTGAIHAGL